jgi:hypothetical protein
MSSLPAPAFLYRRSLSDFQDVARTTPAGVGADVRSATDIASSPHHLTRASGAVPTARSGGGLLFGAASGKTLDNTLVLVQPFVVLVRLVYSTSGDYFPVCDKAAPDSWYIRPSGASVYIRGTSGPVSAAMWSPDSTPRVLGAYFNGASSKIFVAGTKTAVTANATGIVNGLRVGCYSPASTAYSWPDAITDLVASQGVFTDDGLDALAASLEAAP